MSVYRITEFKIRSSDMGEMIGFCETLREDVAAAGAEFIDVVSVGDDKGLVVAKYANEALMAAATDINKQAFGKMVAAGLVDGDSISVQTGEMIFSF